MILPKGLDSSRYVTNLRSILFTQKDDRRTAETDMFFTFKSVVNFLKFLFTYQYIFKQMANYGRENPKVRVIA